MSGPTTTGELRKLAREAESQGRWGAAAIYYREAVKRYRTTGALAAADVAALEQRGDEAARMAHREAHPDYRSPDAVLVLCPLSGATVSIPLRWCRDGDEITRESAQERNQP